MRFCSLRLFVAEQEVLLEVFVRLEQAPSATGCLGRGSGWSKPQPYERGTSFENGFILCGCLYQIKRLEQAPSATGFLGRVNGWSKPQPYRGLV